MYRLNCTIQHGPIYGYCFLHIYAVGEGLPAPINLLNVPNIKRYIPRTAKIEGDCLYGKIGTVNKVIYNLLWDWNLISLEVEKHKQV
jgi:hypothetical protein